MINRYLSRAWPLRSAWLGGCAGWLRLRTVVSVRDLRNRRSLPIGARPLALHLVLGRANIPDIDAPSILARLGSRPVVICVIADPSRPGARRCLAPWTARRYRSII